MIMEGAARIVVIDDHPIVLQGIRALLAETPTLEVVATAVSVDEAIAAVVREQPDLAVLDLRLGDALAPDVMERLLAACPSIKIAVLTAFGDAALLEACRVKGASALLLKETSGLDLVRALREVLAGGTVIDPRLDLNGSRQRAPMFVEGGYEKLSEREYDVLLLLARGMNTREIAAELALMPNTVRSYVQTVLGKLQSKNRVMALATARRLKLI